MNYLTRKDMDYGKWAFFALMAACVLLVIFVDERFIVMPGDKEWTHIQPFKWWLLVHGTCGVTALVSGPLQFSDTLRRTHPKRHRWIGRVYIGAIAIAAPVAGFIGYNFEPTTIRIEQLFQAGGWFLTTAVALVCILNRDLARHKLWMMRSYGFCLVFVLSRVPDAFPKEFRWTDQVLADVLWGLVVTALIAPDIILVVRELWRKRRTRAA